MKGKKEAPAGLEPTISLFNFNERLTPLPLGQGAFLAIKNFIFGLI